MGLRGAWLASAVSVVTLGCGGAPATVLDEDAELPPMAGMIAPVDSRRPLSELLEALERELAAAVETPNEEVRGERMLRAEAISDYLLEAEAPFSYLADGYYLPARLRQLQSRADRIAAQIRRGRLPGRFGTVPFPNEEITALRQEVEDVRAAIARGGAAPPVPLDSLLRPYREARTDRPR